MQRQRLHQRRARCLGSAEGRRASARTRRPGFQGRQSRRIVVYAHRAQRETDEALTRVRPRLALSCDGPDVAPPSRPGRRSSRRTPRGDLSRRHAWRREYQMRCGRLERRALGLCHGIREVWGRRRQVASSREATSSEKASMGPRLSEGISTHRSRGSDRAARVFPARSAIPAASSTASR